MSETTFQLSEKDVCAMVRLIGEVAVLEGDLATKKRYLLDGLCRLVDIDSWIWTLIAKVPAGEQVVAAAFMHGGFSEDRFAAYLKAVEHPDMAHFNELYLKEVYERGTHTTRLRQQLDPDNTFVTSDVYPLWQAADIAPLMLSTYPFEDQSLSLIALYRNEAKALFSERDARIVHVILSEVPWLHMQSLPQVKRTQADQLSPRLRTTLNLLLEGLGRKQIAGHLEISENTVSGYVKQVYRFYGVQSHAELMKFFREGDGGDV